MAFGDNNVASAADMPRDTDVVFRTVHRAHYRQKFAKQWDSRALEGKGVLYATVSRTDRPHRSGRPLCAPVYRVASVGPADSTARCVRSSGGQNEHLVLEDVHVLALLDAASFNRKSPADRIICCALELSTGRVGARANPVLGLCARFRPQLVKSR